MRRMLLDVRGYLALLALCVCAGATSSPAFAQAPVNVIGSIGATSDFVFRGLSYTRGGPALQTSLGIEHPSGLYGGIFASTTNPNAGKSPPLEMDVWLGYGRDVSEWVSIDLRYLHYAYPDDPRVAKYDRDEIAAALGVRGTLFLAATYSPNTEAIASTPGWGEGDTAALEVSVRHQIRPRWSVSVGAGRFFLGDIYDVDYDYWGITLSADLRPFELHLAVLGSDSTAERVFTSTATGERFTATLLYRFAVTR